MTSSLEQRIAKAEAVNEWRRAPQRLVERCVEIGKAMKAASEGRRYDPVPAAPIAKGGGGGGARLVQRCVELRKQMLANAAPDQGVQSAQVAKSTLSPGERLIEAARERAALMKSQV
ncbi:hypothetical protein [Neoroseomonas lacus]|nr:hypothetical protein [Neoroseomonas lacus]